MTIHGKAVDVGQLNSDFIGKAMMAIVISTGMPSNFVGDVIIDLMEVVTYQPNRVLFLVRNSGSELALPYNSKSVERLFRTSVIIMSNYLVYKIWVDPEYKQLGYQWEKVESLLSAPLKDWLNEGETERLYLVKQDATSKFVNQMFPSQEVKDA